MYYDSHTHLNDEKLYPQRKTYIKSFVEWWGKWLINIWVNDSRNKLWIEISKSSKKINCIVKNTIWYHPDEIISQNVLVKDFILQITNLKKTYDENKDFIVWIWECWIDMHYNNSFGTEKHQQELFALHCDLAQQLKLPIIIHSRDWFDLTLDVLKNYKNLKIYFHCWWYWPDEIKKIDKEFTNYFIWFAWNLTYPKAIDLKESLKIIDLNKLLLETDAPYLSPQTQRWKTNEPIFVKYIYDYVWAFLNISQNILQKNIEKNFKSLYEL